MDLFKRKPKQPAEKPKPIEPLSPEDAALLARLLPHFPPAPSPEDAAARLALLELRDLVQELRRQMPSNQQVIADQFLAAVGQLEG